MHVHTSVIGGIQLEELLRQSAQILMIIMHIIG